MTILLPCRHRGPETTVGVFACSSPKLAGLKQVTPAICQDCYCRDHADILPLANPEHLLPCAHLGPMIPTSVRFPTSSEYHCSHPTHSRTTEMGCRNCRDYLFPLLTPRTPIPAVRSLFDLPPRQQQDRWWTWPQVQEAYRQAAAAHGESLRIPATLPYSGQGVVMVGGGRYFPSAYISLRILRHVGCTLPVQLWHLEGEITPRMRDLLFPLGVEVIHADEFALHQPFRFIEGHWWKGWQLKVYALAHSRFEEALLLDADCYPTRNPEFLFSCRAYLEHGSIFWPDYPTSAGLLPPDLWSVFGLEPRLPPFESGQVLVDKKRCWPELQLTLWYNAHADYVYNLLWGDKDTYNLAWRQLHRDFGMLWEQAGWDTHTLLQYDDKGQVLFQHRCRDKFRLRDESFINTPQHFGENTYNPRLVHEDLCFQLREELKQKMGGDPA